MRSGDGDVESERVGDDGHRHSGGLFAAALVEDAAHVALDVGETALSGVLDGLGGEADAFLENGHAFVDEALRHHRMLDATGDMVDAAREPSGFRPAVRGVGVAGEHAVSEIRPGDTLRHIGLALTKRLRDANGDSLFDRVGGRQRRLAEPSLGVVLDRGRRIVFGFDRDGLRVRDVDEYIGPRSRGVAQYASLFDAKLVSPQRMLAAEDFGKQGVERDFAGARHGAHVTGGTDKEPRLT